MDKPFISTVYMMLDKEVNAKSVRAYCKEQGFDISGAYISMLKKYRDSTRVESDHLSGYLKKTTIKNVVMKKEPKSPRTTSQKIKYDMDFMDLVIQAGADGLRQRVSGGDNDISIGDVFTAIQLKQKLSGNATYGLTNYGIEYLQEITEAKYIALMRILYEYTPPEKKEEIMLRLREAEDEFYQGTDYYEEYLKSTGLTNKQIEDRINEKESC